MIQFAEQVPNEQIVAALLRQLSWSQFIEFIPLDDPLKREFYAEIAASNDGAFARCGKRSTACCSSVWPSAEGLPCTLATFPLR